MKISNCSMMKSRIAALLLIFAEVFALGAAWYEPGMTDLADRADHGYGRRRFRDELCDELERRGERHEIDEKEIRREIEKIRKLPDHLALKKLSEALDELDEPFRGLAENIIRQLMKKLSIEAPPKYKVINGYFTAEVAQKKCRAIGGQLAVIRHGIDHSLAWEASSRASKKVVFIGLIRSKQHIFWRDGTKVTYDKFERWSWRIDKPKRHCGVMNTRTGIWSFTWCNAKLPALCQLNSPSKPSIPDKGTGMTSVTSKPSGRKPPTTTKPKNTEIPSGTTKPSRPIKPSGTTKPSRPVKPSGTTKPSRLIKPSGMTKPSKPTKPWEGELARVPIVSEPNEAKPRKFLETELRFMFDYEVSKNDKLFKTDLIKAIGKLLKKDTKDVSILGMRPGSTIVHVKIYLADQDDAKIIKATLHRAAKLGGALDAKFYGRLRPIIDPYVGDEPNAKLKIIIPTVVLLIVLIISVLVVIVIMLKKRRNVRPAVTRPAAAVVAEGLPTYKEFTANDYTKPPGEPNAPPSYDECSKPPIA